MASSGSLPSSKAPGRRTQARTAYFSRTTRRNSIIGVDRATSDFDRARKGYVDEIIKALRRLEVDANVSSSFFVSLLQIFYADGAVDDEGEGRSREWKNHLH